jgi:hypothetical protein
MSYLLFFFDFILTEINFLFNFLICINYFLNEKWEENNVFIKIDMVDWFKLLPEQIYDKKKCAASPQEDFLSRRRKIKKKKSEISDKFYESHENSSTLSHKYLQTLKIKSKKT